MRFRSRIKRWLVSSLRGILHSLEDPIPKDNDPKLEGSKTIRLSPRDFKTQMLRKKEILGGGTILKERYRIEEFLRSEGGMNKYLAVKAGEEAVRSCWDCGNEAKDLADPFCSICGAELRKKVYLITEAPLGDFFSPEAELLSKGVLNPGVKRIYDVFEQRERSYLVEDWLPGGPLAEVARPLEKGRVKEMAIALAETLGYLHQKGICRINLGEENIQLYGGLLKVSSLVGCNIEPGVAPAKERKKDLKNLNRTLRGLLGDDPNSSSLQEIFEDGARGKFSSAEEMLKKLERLDLSEILTIKELPNAGGLTDVGRVRSFNEDNFIMERLTDVLGLYLVADGMGGHEGGEIASRLAANTILEEVRKGLGAVDAARSREDYLKILKGSMEKANHAVYQYGRENQKDMGTTATAALVHHHEVYLANIGDSRAYRIAPEEITRLTVDHSLVAKLISLGRLSPEEARDHPKSNVLYRCIGTEKKVEVDLFDLEGKEGEFLLLCSDGLWGELKDEQIHSIVRECSSPQQGCWELVRAAKEQGGRDNITAVLVRL